MPPVVDSQSLEKTLLQVMKGTSIETATFGQVRVQVARYMGVAESVLEPWREQLGQMLTRIALS